MPIPIIAIAVAAAVAVVTPVIPALLPKLPKKLSGKRTAILGQRQVGKSALLRFLRDPPDAGELDAAADGSFAGSFSLRVGKKEAQFEVPKDLDGNYSALGFKQWKEAVSDAEYIWYLFRADKVAAGDPETLELVRDHLDRIKNWMKTSGGANKRVTLIGTHADLSPAYESDPKHFTSTVGSADAIKLGLVKLNHAELVVGSLNTVKESRKLSRSLAAAL